MKKIRNFLLFIILIAMFIVFAPLLCNAEEIKPSDDFDARYYAETYPDVKAVFGTDEILLYQHYLTYGINEGRYKNLKEEISRTNGELPYLTYVDVNITTQTVKYFEDGIEVMQSPCVTGNVSANNDTPLGTWTIMSMKKGATLKGPTWNVWVDYWMKFTPNACGFHDSTWRDDSEYGGETYKTNGSHGCVNLPHDFAGELYNKVNIGTIVYVHN